MGIGGYSPAVKWMGREADCSRPSGTTIKKEWSYIPTPSYAFMKWTGILKINKATSSNEI
jgi:hypothetical protein